VKVKVYQINLVLADSKVPAELREEEQEHRLGVPEELAVSLPLQVKVVLGAVPVPLLILPVPAQQEFHLLNRRRKGERGVLVVEAVPLMVPHFRQKRGVGEDPLVEEVLHLGEQVGAEEAHSSLLQFPREELGGEVIH
jgi:hypothetical protein